VDGLSSTLLGQDLQIPENKEDLTTPGNLRQSLLVEVYRTVYIF